MTPSTSLCAELNESATHEPHRFVTDVKKKKKKRRKKEKNIQDKFTLFRENELLHCAVVEPPVFFLLIFFFF